MSGAGQPPGLQVGTTRPQSREERRAAAARVRADAESASADSESPSPAEPPASTLPPAAPVAGTAAAAPQQPLQLKARKRTAKRPFATQLRPETIARLDWIKAQGYALTDTVDDAINDYLDRAGVPHLGEGE